MILLGMEVTTWPWLDHDPFVRPPVCLICVLTLCHPLLCLPAPTAGQKKALQQEFEQLLNIFFDTEPGVTKADIKKLRESGVFGPLSFWVTEIKNLEEEAGPNTVGKLGILIRGNLRTERQQVFDGLCEKVKELFGDKYGVLMIEDPEILDIDAADAPRQPPSSKAAAAASSSSNGANDGTAAAVETRVAFQIVPSAALVPPPTPGWAVAVSAVLLLGLLLACGQLSLAANVAKLPRVSRGGLPLLLVSCAWCVCTHG
jgi:hypothetical protein